MTIIDAEELEPRKLGHGLLWVSGQGGRPPFFSPRKDRK
jgi:hypothetical protein